jgi:glycosyltransferase involved in cell wall biosynthesis
VRTAVAARSAGSLDAAGLTAELAAVADAYEPRHIDAQAHERVATLLASDPAPRIVTFVGKFIPQKGVDVLLASLPEVLDQRPDVHVVMAGFGPLRDYLEAFLWALQEGSSEALEETAQLLVASSEAAVGVRPLVVDFLASERAAGTLDAWRQQAARVRIAERVTWLGLVDHDVLAALWPRAEVSIVPSVLAEAFGMVAAEAAACGCVPLVSDHSGLAEVAAVLEAHGVAPVRFAVEDGPTACAAALHARLALPADARAQHAALARQSVVDTWSWDSIAASVAGLMQR